MRRTPRWRHALSALAVLTMSTTVATLVGPQVAQAAPTPIWVVADLVRCRTGVSNSPGARDVVAAIDARIVMPGDLVSPDGATAEFTGCFDPLWGRFKERTRPTPGNHEYKTDRGAAYYDYFGGIAPYYAWTARGWRMYSLNSMCGYHGGCGVGSPMYRWLEADLRAHDRPCEAAYWHHPRWSQGAQGNIERMAPLYALLDRYDVELLFVGNENGVYQRYPALGRRGRPTARGVTEFVVSTGGVTDGAGVVTPNLPAPVVREDGTLGALLLSLAPASWQADFVAEAGSSFTDHAAGRCFEP